MTLENLEYQIGEIALKKNLVNEYFAGGSLYELNAEVINEYPVIFLTPAGDHTVKENTTRYSLTIYYVDRLWDDDRNETDICSAAIETLKNILRQLDYLDWVAYVEDEPVIRLFTETERMNDRVAGAYMNVWIETLNASTCPEFLDELGRPMGNYIPGNINVLDAYATKAWVILQKYADKPWVLEQLENIVVSGGTNPQQVRQMIASALTEYTKTVDFATINNSAITEGGDFQLVEKSDFNDYSAATREELERIVQSIDEITVSGITGLTELSSVTMSILDREPIVLDYDYITGLTQEERTALLYEIYAIAAMDENKPIFIRYVDKNLSYTRRIAYAMLVDRYHDYDNIVFLNFYGIFDQAHALYINWDCEYDISLKRINFYTLPTASSRTKGGIKIGSGLTMVGETLYAEPGVSSAITQDIIALSADTSAITENLSVLSAYTHDSVSSITHTIETLSAATETAVSGLSESLETLSASTVGIGTGLTELSSVTMDILEGEPIVLDYDYITGLTSAERTALWDEIYNMDDLKKDVIIKYSRVSGAAELKQTAHLSLTRRVNGNNMIFLDFYDNTQSVMLSWNRTILPTVTNSNFYTLPTASSITRGGIKVGSGLVMSGQTMSTQYQVWVGTQAQYDALSVYDSNTFYVITGLN